MEEGHGELERWEGYVDWRHRPALKGRHGGMLAASFVLVVEILENLAFLANASNLVTYMTGFMHFPPARAATTVTNFMGTAFLLALLGGFLSDALSTAYCVYLTSAFIELLGLVILTVQAKSPGLKPPACSHSGGPCKPVSGGQAAMLFAGLYLVALGVGGIKGSLPAHGAEQFDESTAEGRRGRSTFFNYFVFCLSCGGLVAVTLVVWVEDNMGWQWGFALATIAIFLSVPLFVAGSTHYRNKLPTGSPLTTIAKVLVAAVLNARSGQISPRNAVVDAATSPTAVAAAAAKTKEDDDNYQHHHHHQQTKGLNFLDRAAAKTPIPACLAVTAEQVDDVKAVLRLLPIFLSTIMLSCCLAQLSTFSVQQAATMNTKLGALNVPPASLPIFPILFIIVLAPLYDHLLLPLLKRAAGNDTGVTHLQRIGVGLALSAVAMAVAAAVELRRKHVAARAGVIDDDPAAAHVPMSFLWVALQFLFLGSADLFTLAGLLEFLFTEAPAGMRSLATALSWASLAMGYYLSSVLVSIVNGVTGGDGRTAWLAGGNLNRCHLERFYWLMCALSVMNFLNYLFWAIRYKYRTREVDRNQT